uniref:Copia protein n=1 Tax=Cajanus cajan TaxID=3821 RepID=A0A151T048_CAJCA|nr:Copia protein [Cajanus cajan]
MLAFVAYKYINLFQIDVKNEFLNGIIKEEVYVREPLGFENPSLKDYVVKLIKAFYGFKQTPRTWYEILINLLINNGFMRGKLTQLILEKNLIQIS